MAHRNPPLYSLLGIIPKAPVKDLVEALGKLEGLESLPVEILLDIYQYLDVESIFALNQVNTLFHGLLKRNKSSILLPVLQREFSPFPELLQVYTASEQDLKERGGTYQPRRVIFRRYPGDSTGVILSRGGFSSITDSMYPKVSFTKIFRGGKPVNAVIFPPPRSIALVERDLHSILEYCLVVRKWERLFPQLQWIADPANCRQLGKQEKERLRRALYRWWLHAYYFHGDFPRPRAGLPESFVNDIRTSQMRMYSTNELLELMDLFGSVKNLILHYIYPNLEQNLGLAPQSNQRMGVHERSHCERIVNTYAKLNPRELMFYFERLYSYPRTRLVNDVNFRHPTFPRDQESLQASVDSAIGERSWLDAAIGSIVELDNYRKGQNELFSGDASLDGSIPPPGVYIRPQFEYSPPGDDGRSLADGTYSFSSHR